MRVIISAGGTGGHIYPALAIINEIKGKEPSSEFLYIGTHNRMEKDIVPPLGIPFKSIEMYGFSKHLFKNFKTASCLFKSFKECRNIIKEFNPDVVIGVGGYVTVPVIVSAKKLGYKTFLHEQNSIPGKANKFLSKYSDMIGVSFKSSFKYLPSSKTYLVGNPCGQEALKSKRALKSTYGFSLSKKLILIVMGSLGAQGVNEFLINELKGCTSKNYEVLFITGNKSYESVSKHSFPSNVKVIPYISGLGGVMKISDLIISRAGASTLSEIVSLRLPSILIPSPYVANNHQYYNALDLENEHASLMIEEKNLKEGVLLSKIDEILGDDDKMKIMKENLSKLAIDDSAFRIYERLKDLCEK